MNVKMERISFKIPPTMEQGSCSITGVSSLTETAEENALWHYNSMRAHDGYPPADKLPEKTRVIILITEEEE